MKPLKSSLPRRARKHPGSPRKLADGANRVNRRAFLGAAIGSTAMALCGCSSSDSSMIAAPRMVPLGGTAAGGPAREGAAIDTHIHLVHGNPNLKPIPEEMERLTQSAPEIKAQRLEMEMEQANVSMAFAMGRREAPSDDPLGINSSL